jgi:predicted nuclease with TOPRIM domain
METALTPEQVDQIYLIFRGTLPNAQERVGRTTSIYKDFGAEVKGTREFLQKEIQRLANENAVLTQRMKDLDGVVVGLEVKVKDLEKQIKDHKCPVVSEKEVARNIALRAWDRIKEWANSFFKS